MQAVRGSFHGGRSVYPLSGDIEAAPKTGCSHITRQNTILQERDWKSRCPGQATGQRHIQSQKPHHTRYGATLSPVLRQHLRRVAAMQSTRRTERYSLFNAFHTLFDFPCKSDGVWKADFTQTANSRRLDRHKQTIDVKKTSFQTLGKRISELAKKVEK